MVIKCNKVIISVIMIKII